VAREPLWRKGSTVPTLFGAIRRLVLAPSLEDVTFAGRGFDVTPTAATRAMEAVPQAVVIGFEWGIDGGDLTDLIRRLDMIDPEQRGFAYEGATMAMVIKDSTGGSRTREFLDGAGEPHLLLAYIGIGFAMSKLPRPLWKKILPDLKPSLFHPTMSWLCVDGYGFDLAYFHKKKWIDEQRVPEPYPWLGHPEYFHRAVDQGIGRALWFMHGGVPDDVTAGVRRFPEERQADLWSGVGLAATFAGGCVADGLTRLRGHAGRYADHLGQGAVFATTARLATDFVPEHSREAVGILAGVTPEEGVMLSAMVHPDPEEQRAEPHYETWRAAIRAELTRRADERAEQGPDQAPGLGRAA
jgi:enediyne biosynthesis protein E2